MAGQALRTRNELEGRLLERAAKDEAFRRALVADPRGTLERELGVRAPSEVVREAAASDVLVGELAEPVISRTAGAI